MPESADISSALKQRVDSAIADRTPLAIVAGGTKQFMGRLIQAEDFDVSGHRGVVSYEASELVLTARAGTPLKTVESTLAEKGQMLAFEPPHFGDGATLGGTVSCGLSGPRRPYAGGTRDFVLGVTLINGRGEILRFGGEVMKNVAGYDVSRLVTGSLGTLGAILDISLKVLPIPAEDLTLAFEMDLAEAIQQMNQWAARPLPLSAACHDGERLRVRLSGTAGGVKTAAGRIGGERQDGEDFWRNLREQRLEFFSGEGPLWRLSVPPAAPPLALPGQTLVDWGGALRWLKGDADSDSIRSVVSNAGGHATLFKGGDRTGQVFHPLPPKLLDIHRRLKNAFDPDRIFNPGRMYEGV
ncbi:MAG TPA: glycolate oxidase subunit GlcE [Gammaproteobacteria bacterium]|nr:glycolate oxidase subunit GlcE [Gammaproteobacteria bacterium]